MYRRYGKDVEFLVVYIREAHPTDGWQVRQNEREEILFAQPTTFKDRKAVAKQMCAKLEISIPTVIDNLDDRVNQDYAAAPDRLYLVGRDGRIAFKGAKGPFGFRPKDLEAAIQAELD